MRRTAHKAARLASAAAILSLLALPPVMTSSLAAIERAPQAPAASPYLTGQLLIAAPGMSDPRFKDSVIYMVIHDEEGAFGLIINKVLGEEPAGKLLPKGEHMDEADDRKIRIHFGGPVDFGRGFVLHTPDYVGGHTIVVNGVFAMTPGEDTALLRALAKGEGPRKSILALGYAGWSPGQLESELNREDWVTATTDESFVFDEDTADKWQRAYDRREFSL